MTQTQKIIKYLAIAFALYLIFNIISGIWWGVGLTAEVLGLGKNENIISRQLEELTTGIDAGKLTTMKIDLRYSELQIVEGDRFLAETSSPDITCRQNKNQMIIEEKNHTLSLGSIRKADTLIVYIPKGMKFDGVIITNDAGSISIQELSTKELYLDLKAGETQIDSLTVSDSATIKGGAGDLIIRDGKIHDLDMKLSAGEIDMQASLTGKSVVNSSLGDVKIQLLDKLENYHIKVKQGLGQIRINDLEIANRAEFGDGENRLDIRGGAGDVIVKTQ